MGVVRHPLLGVKEESFLWSEAVESLYRECVKHKVCGPSIYIIDFSKYVTRRFYDSLSGPDYTFQTQVPHPPPPPVSGGIMLLVSKKVEWKFVVG